jgi:hypothetical protein
MVHEVGQRPGILTQLIQIRNTGVKSWMLSKEKCLEKSQEYLRDRHPQVWERLSVTDEAVKLKVYNLLAEYLQESAPELSDDDHFDLLGAFGTDDTALDQLIDQFC